MCNTAHVFCWWPAAAVGSAALVTVSVQSSELSSFYFLVSAPELSCMFCSLCISQRVTP